MATATHAPDDVRTRLRRLGEPRGVALIGIALGFLAFWLALPPWTVSWAAAPVALGIAGAAAGLWALSRGERKLGAWALAVAFAGTAAGLWAVGQAESDLSDVLNIGLIA